MTARPRVLPPLPVQEIGSLPKTLWRLKAFEKEGVDAAALDQARSEGQRLGIGGHDDLVRLLERRTGFSKDEKAGIKRWASRYSLRYLEQAGLDIVYDGEETRTEMYDWPVARTEGFEERGWCRSWDHLYFKKAAVVAPPHCTQPYHTEEYVHAAQHGQRQLKVPVTGAYTLMDWSFDEYYFPRAKGSTAERRRTARRLFAVDLARDVLRPNLKALTEAGATRIQVDEPGASTKPDEVGVFVESFNESVQGLPGRFSIHLCFSDYPLFFPGILGLKGCSELAIELANKDSWGLGTAAEDRPGYAQTLALWKEHDAPFDIGLGVIDVHTDQVESPDLVRDRVLFAANALGPERVLVNPDCGLRTRRWPVVEAKLASLVAGTRLARKALGLA